MFKKLIEKIFGKRCECPPGATLTNPTYSNYSEMSKGDLKKLVAKGEIKSIYKPYK